MTSLIVTVIWIALAVYVSLKTIVVIRHNNFEDIKIRWLLLSILFAVLYMFISFDENWHFILPAALYFETAIICILVIDKYRFEPKPKN